jgi:hypothetical protein
VPRSVDPERLRLTVPAEADFVRLLRVTVRMGAGRMGWSDDLRAKAQAGVGAAFFALVPDDDPASSVELTVEMGPDELHMDLVTDCTPEPGHELDTSPLDGVVDRWQVADGGRRLHLWQHAP